MTLPRGVPRVVIDARMVEAVPHGIARYVTRLASGLRGLSRALPYEPVFLLPGDWPHADFEGFEAVRAEGIPFLSGRELVRLAPLVRSAGAAVYHSPSFASLPIVGPGRMGIPWIQTVHDLIHLHYGDWRQRAYYRWLLRPFARRARALATVSEFSRGEIAAWLGISPEAIEIVWNALEPDLLSPPPESESREILGRFGLEPKGYFFCLSNPKPHKNIPLLLKAYEKYRQRGDSARFPLVVSISDRSDIPGVRAVGGLGDREARVLRAHCAAVAFPSLYEGFGLPPVEAVLAGVPILVSSIPPHREGLTELSPGEARWVDPMDIEGWAEAFGVAAKGLFAGATLEARHRTLDRFNEKAMAERMDRIYRRVLSRQA